MKMTSTGLPPGMDASKAATNDPETVRDGHKAEVADTPMDTAEEHISQAHRIQGRRRSSASRSVKEPRLSTQPPHPSHGRPSTFCSTPDPSCGQPHCSSEGLPKPLEPPVTKSTLSELDVSKIFHNPKLRHDINFDPELHFRPNLDGEKGRKKQEKANQFWAALKDDLMMFLVDRPTFQRLYGSSDSWTMPSLLKAVKEIIQTLVPQPERQMVEQGFDVPFLMQQFRKGVLELDKLAEWLSNVLKSHCAPMRDEWVDTMYRQLSQGNRTYDIDLLVTGLRSLLSVLEAMKLDVANHQIRTLRPALIDETTHFEQKFFHKKISVGRLDVTNAHEWYLQAEEAYGHSALSHQRQFGDMGVFFEALTRSLLPSHAHQQMPTTFLFDEERIVKLRSDVLDLINMDIIMRTYDSIMRLLPTRLPEADDVAEDHRSSHRYSRDCEPDAASSYGSRPSSLASSVGTPSSSSSSRSSYQLPSYLGVDSMDHDGGAQALYQSLVALIQTANTGSRQLDKWEALVPDLALEVFRHTNFPIDCLAQFEETIARRVCRVHDAQYQEVEERFHSLLLQELGKTVKGWKALPAIGLFNAATKNRSVAEGRLAGLRLKSPSSTCRSEETAVQDLAVRTAHLGILHWRSWSRLAYVFPEGEL